MTSIPTPAFGFPQAAIANAAATQAAMIAKRKGPSPFRHCPRTGGYARDRRAVRRSSLFPDTNHTDWVYTPDTSEPAPDEHLNWDVSGRVTWQASARNKFNVATPRQNKLVKPSEVDGSTSGAAGTILATEFYDSKDGWHSLSVSGSLVVNGTFDWILGVWVVGVVAT